MSRAFWLVIAGLAGGSALGLELSRRGDWLQPLPWLIYGLVIVLLTGLAAYWGERRRL